MSSLRPSGKAIYFFGALGGLLFGSDTGVISGARLFIPRRVRRRGRGRGTPSQPAISG